MVNGSNALKKALNVDQVLSSDKATNLKDSKGLKTDAERQEPPATKPSAENEARKKEQQKEVLPAAPFF